MDDVNHMNELCEFVHLQSNGENKCPKSRSHCLYRHCFSNSIVSLPSATESIIVKILSDVGIIKHEMA